ncbi:response regulator transcription factor [Alteribacillus sp. JSM 102045]|uniref:response regulator transcription factor n=1 Tax=Alteribacillus sp. JSM 102045 TaxID=1562101 RepID=UPI0035BF64C9
MTMTFDMFMKKYVNNQHNFQLGFAKSVVSPSFQKHTIQFDAKSKYQKEDVYIVHLIPESSVCTSTPTIDHKLSFLTPREMEICQLIRKGCTNSEIAQQSFISINTVKRHIQNIFSKLNVKNRTGLISKLDESMRKTDDRKVHFNDIWVNNNSAPSLSNDI